MKNKTSERILKARERQLEALELRKQGFTLEAIAERLGYSSASGAHKAITSALDKHTHKAVDELRKMQLARLDEMQYAIWDEAIKDLNLRAFDTLLKIMARRAKLLGLDIPASYAHGAQNPSSCELLEQENLAQ